MNNNSKAIIVFCSNLSAGKDIQPLQPHEWNDIVVKMLELGIVPENLLSFSTQDFMDILGESPENAQRMTRLIERGPELAIEVVEYESKGIQIITRADEAYPRKLKTKLKHNAPPLFYCAGDLTLLQDKSIGYVGSRKITPGDAKFTSDTVAKTTANNYAVVTGGAKGVDQISSEAAIRNGGHVIEFLGDSMMRRLKNTFLLESVQNGNLLMLSAVNPDAGFFAGNMMARNKYIYAQSEGTVVVHSELKGGTWTGANENLRHGWTPLFCWNNPEYEGNQAIIQRGAFPIDESWDGIPSVPEKPIEPEDQPETDVQQDAQLSLPGFEQLA